MLLLKKIVSAANRRLALLTMAIVLAFAIVILWIVATAYSDPAIAIGLASVSAFFSAISAFAALVQAVETQRQRENTERPHVMVYFEGKSNHTVYAIIENFGHAPAKEIRIKFDPSPSYMQEKPLNDVGPFANSIPLLPAGKKIEQVIESGPDLLAPDRNIRFGVSIRYEALNGQVFDEEDIIDLTYMRGGTLPSPTTSEALVQVEKRLEDIAKTFKSVTNFSSIMVESPGGQRRRIQGIVKDAGDESGPIE